MKRVLHAFVYESTRAHNKTMFVCRENCNASFKHAPNRVIHEKDKCRIYGGEIDKRMKPEFKKACEASFNIDETLLHTSKIFYSILEIPKENRKNIIITGEKVETAITLEAEKEGEKEGEKEIIENVEKTTKTICNIHFPLTEISENERLLIAKVALLENKLKNVELKHAPYIPLIENGEYVYMLLTPQAYQIGDNCYKIGRCKGMIERLGGYPKSSRVLVQYRTINAKGLEDKIKEAFKADKRITQAKDYGTEYYRGNFTNMEDLFHKIYKEHNPNIENDEDYDNGEDDEEEDDDEDEEEDDEED